MKYGRKRKNISIQFIIFMNNNSICEEFQSGFCTFHSPETTLIKAKTMIYCLLPTPGLFHTCPPHLWCPSRINFRSSFFWHLHTASGQTQHFLCWYTTIRLPLQSRCNLIRCHLTSEKFAHYLAATFDSNLSFDNQVSGVVQSSFSGGQ